MTEETQEHVMVLALKVMGFRYTGRRTRTGAILWCKSPWKTGFCFDPINSETQFKDLLLNAIAKGIIPVSSEILDEGLSARRKSCATIYEAVTREG